MSALSWRCDLHGVTTDRDCSRCDDELIALAEDSGKTCHRCGRALRVGEAAWADEWTVIADDYRSAWRETRYTCDDCEEQA